MFKVFFKFNFKGISFSYTCLLLFLLIPACTTDDDMDDEDEMQIEASSLIDANITEDRILTNINSDPNDIDYVVEGSVDVRAVLTIDPGVVIAFKSGAKWEIESSAAIIAKGTASEPIVFKGEESIPGFWDGITLYSTDVRNAFSHCTFSDGGEVANLVVGESIYEARASIDNCTFSNGSQLGLFIKNDAANNLLSFTNNSFNQNATGAMELPASSVVELDNTTSWGTGNSTIKVTGVRLEASSKMLWKKLQNAHPITIMDEIELMSGLQIEAGAVLEFAPAGFIDVGWNSNPGYLEANGTATEKIVFRGQEALAGFWPGLIISSDDVRNVMSHCIISDGGGAELGCCDLPLANIVVDGYVEVSRLVISNCEIMNSLGCGISKKESATGNVTLVESGNTFVNNTNGNICE